MEVEGLPGPPKMGEWPLVERWSSVRVCALSSLLEDAT